LDEIRLEIENLEVRTDAEWALYLQALQGIHDLNDARRDRLVDTEEGLPALLWVVLLLGGVIVVGFTYLFGLDNTLVHTLMVGALAAVIALSLFTVGALDYPFGWGVTPGTAVSTTAMHANTIAEAIAPTTRTLLLIPSNLPCVGWRRTDGSRN
jgi:hypothetical protein